MKIKAQQLVDIKKLPVGFHEVKIVQIIDKQFGEGEDRIQYIDVIFHGTEGFIISSFFNNYDGLEKLILLFRVCRIDTPLQYSINTCLLTFQKLVIQIEDVSDKFGNTKTEVIGLYTSSYSSSYNSDELSVPEGIEIKNYISDPYRSKELEYMFPIDPKYYYLR